MSLQFEGFTEEMFSFLYYRRVDDEDGMQGILRRMDAFGTKLRHKSLQALDSSFYRAHHVACYPEEQRSCLLSLGSANRGHLLSIAHPEVSLSEAGLYVHVHAGSKWAIRLLRENLRCRTDEFLRILTKLPEPFELRLSRWNRRRRKRRPVVPPLIRVSHQEVRQPACLQFQRLLRLLDTIPCPIFSVSKHLDRRHVVALGGNGLISEVSDMMRAFHPLVLFLNENVADSGGAMPSEEPEQTGV